MNITQKIREFVDEEMVPRQPYHARDFRRFGSPSAVGQALSRLTREGILYRIVHGVYVKAEISEYTGCQVLPSVVDIVQVLTNGRMQLHGAQAALVLGLTTQVPAQTIYLVEGPTRILQIGNMRIHLRHTTTRKLALAERTRAGLALSALWYLGQSGVTPEIVDTVKSKLTPLEYYLLTQADIPAWLRKKLNL